VHNHIPALVEHLARNSIVVVVVVVHHTKLGAACCSHHTRAVLPWRGCSRKGPTDEKKKERGKRLSLRS
jgi:hypothetical protein